jgi:hypothetical protein
MGRRTCLLAVAVASLAAAAGKLISRGDPMAPTVVDGGHVKADSLPRTDQQHARLRVRVRAYGGTFGDASDATSVERFALDTDLVKFEQRKLVEPIATTRNPR